MSATWDRERRKARRQRGSLIAAAVLIGLGVLFLGQNFGFIDRSIWSLLWRLWPLVLVAVGLRLIFQRRPNRMSSAYSQTSTVGSAGSERIMEEARQPASAPFQPAGTEHIIEGIGDATKATVELHHGAGRLSVAALPPESQAVLEADLTHGPHGMVHRTNERKGEEAIVRLRAHATGALPRITGQAWRDDWAVRVTPAIPLMLWVRSRASDINLDLRSLIIQLLDIETGASALNVVLPRAALHTEVRIRAGAAGVDITVPEGVAARIQVESGLSGITIDQARFPKEGHLYQSPDYDTAANRVNLDIETGVSGLTIR